MGYDNRTNRVHRFIRRAFGEYPITTWSLLIFLVGMLVLTILFPFPMWLIWAVLGGCGVLIAVIYGIVNEFV